MKKILPGFLLVLSFVSLGCTRVVVESEGVRGYDISPDGRQLVFAFRKEGRSVLYTVELDGTGLRKLADTEHLNPVFPVFAPDGKRILFVSYYRGFDNPLSRLSLIDVDGGNLRSIETPQQHVTEAIFSQNGQMIYFLEWGFFGHYSPIARSSPHDFDVYAMDIGGTDINPVTHLKSYEMSALSISEGGKHLVYQDYDDEGGRAVLLELATPSNVTYVPMGIGFSPRLSPDGMYLLCSAVVDRRESPYRYDLHKIDIQTKRLVRLTRLNSNAFAPRFVPPRGTVIFLEQVNWPEPQRHKHQFWEMDIDGTNLRKINVPMP